MFLLIDTGVAEGMTTGPQRVYIELDSESPLVTERRTYETEFTLVNERNGRNLTVDQYEDGELHWPAAVSGETNLMPGSRLTVRFESQTDPSIRRETTATVRENGTFETDVNISGVAAPELYVVTVGPKQFHGSFGQVPAQRWSPGDQSMYDGETDIRFRGDGVPPNGLLVAYAYDATTERFRVLDAANFSQSRLTVPTPETEQHVLVVAHRDEDNDGAFDGPTTDVPYRVDGRPIQLWTTVVDGRPSTARPTVSFDAGRVVGEPTETPTPAASETPTERATPTRPATETPTSDTSPSATVVTETTGGNAPGFDLLAALIACAGATWVAARREQ